MVESTGHPRGPTNKRIYRGRSSKGGHLDSGYTNHRLESICKATSSVCSIQTVVDHPSGTGSRTVCASPSQAGKKRRLETRSIGTTETPITERFDRPSADAGSRSWPGRKGTNRDPQLRREDAGRCWQALRYTRPQQAGTTPVLRGPRGEVAGTIDEKEALIRTVAFPEAPQGGIPESLPPGMMHTEVTEETVQRALFSQAVQKAPGVDRLNFHALRLLWAWDAPRLVALSRQCFRLGVHPPVWKTARGILLRKQGKPDYSEVKAYRVISLLNCLGRAGGAREDRGGYHLRNTARPSEPYTQDRWVVGEIEAPPSMPWPV